MSIPSPNVRPTWPRALALVALLAATAPAAPTAAAQGDVAELTVVAYGAQRFDLATGRTVLEAGGEVTDRASGVRLTAAWIAYVDGASLEAEDATIDGDFGRVRAARVFIDLALGRVRAEGDLEFERAGVRARADRLGLDGPAGLAWLAGGVVSDRPEAAADAVWIDVDDGRLLLVGPYRYTDGPFALEGGAGARLQLDPIVVGEAIEYDARTDVDEDFEARVDATPMEPGPTEPIEP